MDSPLDELVAKQGTPNNMESPLDELVSKQPPHISPQSINRGNPLGEIGRDRPSEAMALLRGLGHGVTLNAIPALRALLEKVQTPSTGLAGISRTGGLSQRIDELNAKQAAQETPETAGYEKAGNLAGTAAAAIIQPESLLMKILAGAGLGTLHKVNQPGEHSAGEILPWTVGGAALSAAPAIAGKAGNWFTNRGEAKLMSQAEELAAADAKRALQEKAAAWAEKNRGAEQLGEGGVIKNIPSQDNASIQNEMENVYAHQAQSAPKRLFTPVPDRTPKTAEEFFSELKANPPPILGKVMHELAPEWMLKANNARKMLFSSPNNDLFWGNVSRASGKPFPIINSMLTAPGETSQSFVDQQSNPQTQASLHDAMENGNPGYVPPSPLNTEKEF